jgi:hypothetical protein
VNSLSHMSALCVLTLRLKPSMRVEENVGFEVLTAVAMKCTTIFWDIPPCSPLKVNRYLGGTSPPSSGSKNKQSKKPA